MSSRADFDYARRKGLTTFWGSLVWETDKEETGTKFQELYFPFKINAGTQRVTIQIPEGEIFAALGQFLEKHISKFSFDFGDGPINVNIRSAKLVPRLPI